MGYRLKKVNSIINALSLLILVSASSEIFSQTRHRVSIEGHRGARGHLPENTIPSFIKAVELGADTVELDVVISRDKKVVVSHEPWFSYLISLDPNGKSIAADKQKEHNIYKMSYAEIRKYDVGSLGNPSFPQQVKTDAHKPLLSEVFDSVDTHAKQKKLAAIRYNIEIKSTVEGDDMFHPSPGVFAKLVYDEIVRSKLIKRVIVQSFDVRSLQAMRMIDPSIKLALLVGNKDGVVKNIESLGFKPDTYSPHFSLVDEKLVEYCRQKRIKIVPWTVNELSDLERMKKFKLDGIITDYPDRAVQVFMN